MGERLPWWKTGVVYQAYPRSFMDGSGDGVGDLEGITARLDHLRGDGERSLGVDALWLSPVHPSPQCDFGYDISDYRGIDPVFGDMAAFRRLVDGCHRRGLRLVLDLVVNHTSDQHPWFQASRSSREDPHRDWYLWRDGRAGRPPNNWASTFGGSGWTYDASTDQWYFHSFLDTQPDLNWRNPAVQQEVLDTMRFWMDQGVDGFRLDVFNCYLKDAAFRDNPRRAHPGGLFWPYIGQRHLHDRDQPALLEALAAMRACTDAYPDRVMVGETLDEDPWYQRAADYCRHGGQGLHLVFNFRLLRSRWDARHLGRAVRAWHEGMPQEGWPTWVFSNHDFRRHASRYDAGGLGDARAKLAALLLLTLRGTPFLYYGEEIAMREGRIPRRLIQDPPGKRFWPFYRGRDGCRTPMQWDGSPQAGFTTGTPWLPVNPDFEARNVAAQHQDPASVLSTYRRLIRLRAAEPAIAGGELVLPEADHPQVLTWRREGAGRAFRVVANVSSGPAVLETGEPAGEVRFSTHGRAGPQGPRLALEPLEGLVLEVPAAG